MTPEQIHRDSASDPPGLVEAARATGVPSTPDADESLHDGIRAESLGALDRAIEAFTVASRSTDPTVAAEAFARLADAHRSAAHWPEALEAARRAQEVARAFDLDAALTHAMVAEANVLMCGGKFPDATAIFEKVLALTTDPRMRGLALQNIGSILAQQGRLRAAQRAFAESLGQFQRAGYRTGEAVAMNNCGRAALDAGDYLLAADLLRQARSLARELDRAELLALVTLNQAETELQLGDIAKAQTLVAESFGFFAGCGNKWREIECLRLFGLVHERRGDLREARSCYERGLAMARALDAQVEIRSLTDLLSRVKPHGGTS